MAIISASRRTDIPAFYADWFMNRIRAGYFYRVNPFNTHQVTGFSLAVDDVDAICFWTKNPKPLLQQLGELDDLGYRYYFQFTLNPYDAAFEPHVPPLPERIATFTELAGRIGPQRVVWRYDPIILSSATPLAYHLEQAESIATQLRGATQRLVFSFLDCYGKVAGRLQEQTGIVISDITVPHLRGELEQLAWGLKNIADANGMRILSCAEEVDLSVIGIEHGSCIDGELIRELCGGSHNFVKDKNQRGTCGCVESADMGIYNTCFFKCAYCYANMHETTIEANRQHHNPDSASLLYDYSGKIEIRTDSAKKTKSKKSVGCQPELF